MIKRFLVAMTLVPLSILGGGPPVSAQDASVVASSATAGHHTLMPGQILVKVRPNTTADEIYSLSKAQGAEIVESITPLGIYLLKVTRPTGKAAAYYGSHPKVEYAQPNYNLAEVGGEPITSMDMVVAIQRIMLPLRHLYTRPDAKEELLRSLVNEKLFHKAAKEDGLDRVPEVQRKIDEAVSRTLAREYKNRIRSVPISEKELVAYYEDNIEKFQLSEQIRGRRILVQTKQEAEETLAQLKAGTPFERLAQERSKDPTAKNGGQFGWFGRGRMVPELEQVVFALNKGEMSGIITTRFGYYIVKVEDRRGPGQVPFQEVRKRIKGTLEVREKEALVEKRARELAEKYPVNLHLEFLPEVQVSSTGGTGQEEIMQILREVIERPY